MSDVRILSRPRVEADFKDDADTLNEDYEAAIAAYRQAVEAAKSLGWNRWLVSVTHSGTAYSDRTVSLERDDEPQ